MGQRGGHQGPSGVRTLPGSGLATVTVPWPPWCGDWLWVSAAFVLLVLDSTAGLSPTALPAAPTNLTTACFVDGAVYALGGMGADTSPQALVRVYEPAKDHWQPLPSMPTPCYAASAFLQGNKIFVLGRCCWGKPSIPPCPCPLPLLPPQTRERPGALQGGSVLPSHPSTAASGPHPAC